MNIEDLTILAINASLAAGKAILKIYEGAFIVEKKKDDSPLTIADKNAHNIITSFLEKTEYPILSEEGRDIPFEERKEWETYWIVDPLDGTKEFVKRNGDFTVNIALMSNNKPIMGVIYIPVSDTLYFGGELIGSYKHTSVSRTSELVYSELTESKNQIPLTSNPTTYTIVASRSHLSQETKDYINKLEKTYGEVNRISRGSSLKICMVAEGVAHEYPRFAPTMEWDIAAGHAIILGVGGEIINTTTKKSILYNKINLLNNWFVVK